MAGDWIKMRGNLWDDPRVAKIVDITESSEAAVIGALYWLWSTADQHTTDGVMLGLTMRSIDRKTGVNGFADALCTIGWIADHPEGIRIVDFETHNGASAKKRCQTAKRVANHTATNAPLTQEQEKTNAPSVSTPLAREEKRREEKKEEKRETTTRGARLSIHFEPDLDFAKKNGIQNPVEEIAKFRDYWNSVAGAKGVKLDWQATWRTWVRNSKSFAKPSAYTPPSPAITTPSREAVDPLMSQAVQESMRTLKPIAEIHARLKRESQKETA